MIDLSKVWGGVDPHEEGDYVAIYFNFSPIKSMELVNCVVKEKDILIRHISSYAFCHYQVVELGIIKAPDVTEVLNSGYTHTPLVDADRQEVDQPLFLEYKTFQEVDLKDYEEFCKGATWIKLPAVNKAITGAELR